MKMEKNLRVKTATTAGMGLGLFTTRARYPGNLTDVQYTGTRLDVIMNSRFGLIRDRPGYGVRWLKSALWATPLSATFVTDPRPPDG